MHVYTTVKLRGSRPSLFQQFLHHGSDAAVQPGVLHPFAVRIPRLVGVIFVLEMLDLVHSHMDEIRAVVVVLNISEYVRAVRL